MHGWMDGDQKSTVCSFSVDFLSIRFRYNWDFYGIF